MQNWHLYCCFGHTHIWHRVSSATCREYCLQQCVPGLAGTAAEVGQHAEAGYHSLSGLPEPWTWGMHCRCAVCGPGSLHSVHLALASLAWQSSEHLLRWHQHRADLDVLGKFASIICDNSSIGTGATNLANTVSVGQHQGSVSRDQCGGSMIFYTMRQEPKWNQMPSSSPLQAAALLLPVLPSVLDRAEEWVHFCWSPANPGWTYWGGRWSAPLLLLLSQQLQVDDIILHMAISCTSCVKFSACYSARCTSASYS